MNHTYKYILGIQSFANSDSGAAIVRTSANGEVLDYVAISEERLIRKKYPYTFPLHSLGYCMEHFGLESLDQIDVMVTDNIRIKRWFRSGPTYPGADFDYIKAKLDIDPRKIVVIGHHEAHAASTFYTSGFSDAAILIVDGNGSDVETTSYFQGNGFKINLLDRFQFQGIGTCYSQVTNWILSMGTGGEGKTMGLAPYGEQYEKVLDFETSLDGIKNDFSNFTRRLPMSDVLNHLADPEKLYPLKREYRRAGGADDLLQPYFARVAFDVQQEAERVLTHLASDLQVKTRAKNLCIAGGVGLNSVSNKIILDEAGFDEVFIFPACSDSGIPFGLAIWGYYNLQNLGEFPRKKIEFLNAYVGKVYDDENVKKTLDRHSVKFRDTDLAEVARLISDGKVVHWFSGGSEYGPRALGHRSILADPRRAEVKDLLNSTVKHRESFRPFAPSVLEQYAGDYFELDRSSPYMLLIAKVKQPDVIPGVTHIDQTARVQTVNPQDNPGFYDLIEEFRKITGVPVLVNTSFNDAGEPIVETPQDAAINFLKYGTDYLVFNETILVDPADNEHVNVVAMAQEREVWIQKDRQRYLDLYCPGYDASERDFFIGETNKMAEWHAKYRSVYELEKKTRQWVAEGTRVVIIGTPDHTAILPQYINEFVNVNVVGFVPFEGRYDTDPDSTTAYPEIALETLGDLAWDEMLISSWEFQFTIQDQLQSLELDRPVYPIYDNASRSFMDVLHGRFPVFAGTNVSDQVRNQA